MNILRLTTLYPPLLSRAQVTFLRGGTGSGKTSKLIEMAYSHLQDDTNHKVIVIGLFSLRAADYVYYQIITKLGGKNPHLALYLANTDLSKSPLCTRPESDVLPKVILCTFAYLRKRGASHFIFPLLLDLY